MKEGSVLVTLLQRKMRHHILPVSPVYLRSDLQFQLPHLVLG